MGNIGAHMVETPLGVFSVVWSATGISRCVLPEPDRASAQRRLAERGGANVSIVDDQTALPVAAQTAIAALRAYAAGDEAAFDSVVLDMAGIDPFRHDIYTAARGLRHGEIVTYGELALRAGHPGKARETGAALGSNPFPPIVPCHRIIAAGGKLGGFSAAGGTRTKKRLLAHERAVPPAQDPAQGAFAF